MDRCIYCNSPLSSNGDLDKAGKPYCNCDDAEIERYAKNTCLRTALEKYANHANWTPMPEPYERYNWLMAWIGDEYKHTPWMIAQDALKDTE